MLQQAPYLGAKSDSHRRNRFNKFEKNIPEVLFITSYPPRQCGIATYSQDLIRAMNEKFGRSISIKVCALESEKSDFTYSEEVSYILNTSRASEYSKLASYINQTNRIKTVLIQHEFGFFRSQPESFLQFLYELVKPVMLVFHTVLPNPDKILLSEVKSMAANVGSVIVMTKNASDLLIRDYGVSADKISIIAHGTHLVEYVNAGFLKEKYGLKDRKVLTTFGLLSSGKNIETTLEALPDIVRVNPEVKFLIIGKTHPEVVRKEGEKYRESLEALVKQKNLTNHVEFINKYLALPDLLDYLKLTDIYLFTSNDPNQAVSGTFAYAMSCGCCIISTPIPHAKEMLSNATGIIVDFNNPKQITDNVIRLVNNEELRLKISSNAFQKIISTSWQNSAVAHALVLEKISGAKIKVRYSLPALNLNHIKKMTTNFGFIQFSINDEPDIESGYTLDDNARALISMCMHYEMTSDSFDLIQIKKYLRFIKYCQQPDGKFLNYVDKNKKFTDQNSNNLNDANGRAIWALGYVISKKTLLPARLVSDARTILKKAIPSLEIINSPRAMAFILKGLSCIRKKNNTSDYSLIMETFADRLVKMYKHESSKDWEWYEGYLTYANSILPEGLLCAWSITGKSVYKEIAVQSFDFLLRSTFNNNKIEVISNKGWLKRGGEAGQFGEQPIDVAYTILTLARFYDELKDPEYLRKLFIAFTWFLGNNRLSQIIYNPCTGGCYDGMEETQVNFNQGAESTISYLLARLTIEKYKKELS